MVSLRTWRACLTADVNCIASASDRAWQQKSVCVRDASSLASSAVPTSPSLQTKQISPLDAALQTSKSLKLYRSHAISPPVWGRISKKVEGSCYSVSKWLVSFPPAPSSLQNRASTSLLTFVHVWCCAFDSPDAYLQHHRRRAIALHLVNKDSAYAHHR